MPTGWCATDKLRSFDVVANAYGFGGWARRTDELDNYLFYSY